MARCDRRASPAVFDLDENVTVWAPGATGPRNTSMVLTGAFKKGAVTLEGEYHSATGKSFLQRITWKAEGSSVRESAVLSKDGGKTWEPSFDVLFKKRR